MKRYVFFGSLHRTAKYNLIWIVAFFSFVSCRSAKEVLRPPSLPRDTLAGATLPQEGLNFLILGDWGRSGKYNQREVAGQMGVAAGKMNGRFVVTTGDNFYEKGPKNVHDPAWQISFEDVYTAASLMIPWYATLGNHDYKGNVQAQIDYSRISTRWRLPARYYTLVKEIDDTTCVQFVFLDTTPLMELPGKKKKQYRRRNAQAVAQLHWLDSTLARSHCQWKIAAGHHPVYAAGSRHGQIRQMVTHLKPLLEKHGVQAYFSGHEHDLQYIKGESRVNYFISGAGSKTHRVRRNPRSIFSDGAAGFIAVSLRARQMEVLYIDYRGNILYRGKIAR